MKNQKGQSLVELVVAIGVFVILIGALTPLIFNSYTAGYLASEITQATFLAEEGLEATRSIRDNSWNDLMAGEHYLNNSTGNWQFSETPETIDGKFNRVITVGELGANRKRVISKINWQLSEAKSQEISLITYLTNWQKISGVEIKKPTAYTDFPPGNTINETNAYDYPDGTTFATTLYDITKNPLITFYNWQLPTQSYTSLVLKYRYHADGATNDRYAVAYSTSGCSGVFTDLVSPTSATAPDTTVLANLSPSQDLSQLCLKIYSQKVGAADQKKLYTRDIWTEGSF